VAARQPNAAPSGAVQVLHPADDAPGRCEPGKPGGCAAVLRQRLGRTHAPL